LVGTCDDPEFPRTRSALGPGDLLLMCTDGVQRDVRGGSAVAVVGNLMDIVLAFPGCVPRHDVAVVGLRVA
jgi:hypothetical protein